MGYLTWKSIEPVVFLNWTHLKTVRQMSNVVRCFCWSVFLFTDWQGLILAMTPENGRQPTELVGTALFQLNPSELRLRIRRTPFFR